MNKKKDNFRLHKNQEKVIMTGGKHYFYFPDFRPCGSGLPSHGIAIRVIPLAVLKHLFDAVDAVTRENREKGHTACGIETTTIHHRPRDDHLSYREKGHTACGIETIIYN